MMRGLNNSQETVNAAATAIVYAENRVQQSTVQRRRWGGCLNVYWCFGSQRNGKRIGHAVLTPETTLLGTVASATENPTHPPSQMLPFIAPPSSPASFLQSEPPSATHSPAELLALTSHSTDAYSPRGPRSIFAIGPYAHETQLVSPPVFSTFTTEPSTAPLTPPPEAVHLTTPSSPEVPFARMLISLDPTLKSTEVCQRFPSSQSELKSYQLCPGSPVSHLISPRSGISGSGTSSPFLDLEFPSSNFPSFRVTESPKLSSIDWLSARTLLPRREYGSVTADIVEPTSQKTLLLERHISAVASLSYSDNRSQNDEAVVKHRVSFDLTTEDVTNCTGKEPAFSTEASSKSSLITTEATSSVEVEREQLLNKVENACEGIASEISNGLQERSLEDDEEWQQQQQQRQQPSLVKEFKFDNTDRAMETLTAGSDWWVKERAVGAETKPHNNWAFFPMIQPSIS